MTIHARRYPCILVLLVSWLAFQVSYFPSCVDYIAYTSAQPTLGGSAPPPVGEGCTTPVVVQDLFLVDAVTGLDLEKLFSGTVIDAQNLTTPSITIRAELDFSSLTTSVGTGIKTLVVMFDLDDGLLQRIESTPLLDIASTYNLSFYLAGKDEVSNKPFAANSLLSSSSSTRMTGTKFHTISVKAICTTNSANNSGDHEVHGSSIVDKIQVQPNGDQQIIGTNPKTDEINNVTATSDAASNAPSQRFLVQEAVSGQDFRRRNTETSNSTLNTTRRPDGSLTVTFSILHTRSSEAPISPILPTTAPTPRTTTSPIQTTSSPFSTTQSPSSVGTDDKTKYDVRGYKVHPNGYLNFDGNDTIYVNDKITIGFEGPFASETGTTDRDNDYYRPSSTFADYRLDVHFFLVAQDNTTHNGSQHYYVVPGYFTAYGHVANTPSSTGNAWLCHFRPDHVGVWNWTASFKQGMNVAQQQIRVHSNHTTWVTSSTTNSTSTGTFGDPTGLMDGSTGSFVVTMPSDSAAASSEQTLSVLQVSSGNRRKLDRLIHPPGTNRYEISRSDNTDDSTTGYKPFVKIGTGDTPIDLLSYESNWNSDTMPSKHIVDYIEGNPTWAGGQGKNTIGAINYVSKSGINTVTIATISDTFHPFAVNNLSLVTGTSTAIDIDHHYVLMSYNVTKLAQCEIIVAWIDKCGLSLNLRLSDTKVQFLDSDVKNGVLYDSRRLYYREMIARFGYHSAITWYLDGDGTSTITEILQRAEYIRSVDPYKNPIIVRVNPSEEPSFMKELVSNVNVVDGISLQSVLYERTDSTINDILKIKETVGKELSSATIIEIDAFVVRDPDDIDMTRQNVLWSSLLGGGIAGIMYNNYYYGQDFTHHQPLWEQSYYAVSKFFQNTTNILPYYGMTNAYPIVSSGSWCIMNDLGTIIVVYKKRSVTFTISVKFPV